MCNGRLQPHTSPRQTRAADKSQCAIFTFGKGSLFLIQLFLRRRQALSDEISDLRARLKRKKSARFTNPKFALVPMGKIPAKGSWKRSDEKRKARRGKSGCSLGGKCGCLIGRKSTAVREEGGGRLSGRNRDALVRQGGDKFVCRGREKMRLPTERAKGVC